MWTCSLEFCWDLSIAIAEVFLHGCYNPLLTFARPILLRENEKRKKEEALLESEWDDLGSAITEVYNMPVGQDDDDVDLDSMIV